MLFIPNRTKICEYCGQVILYNEEYAGVDTLNANNEVETRIHHTRCYGAMSGLNNPRNVNPIPYSPNTGGYPGGGRWTALQAAQQSYAASASTIASQAAAWRSYSAIQQAGLGTTGTSKSVTSPSVGSSNDASLFKRLYKALGGTNDDKAKDPEATT